MFLTLSVFSNANMFAFDYYEDYYVLISYNDGTTTHYLSAGTANNIIDVTEPTIYSIWEVWESSLHGEGTNYFLFQNYVTRCDLTRTRNGSSTPYSYTPTNNVHDDSDP